jgi:dienelactone hydrolase
VSGIRGRFVGIAVTLVAGVTLSGCFLPPEGAAPLRYRDDLPGKTVSVTSGIVYSTVQDGTANPLALDVYRPTPDTVTKRPLVLLVHGGGFRSGNKLNSVMVQLANAYARRGFVAASIDYRLLGQPGAGCDNPGGNFDACRTAVLAAQHDAQAAIRYLRANATTYGIDPGRVAIQGGSAGGATALVVGVHEEDPGNSGTPGQDSSVRAALPISGGVGDGVRGELIPFLDRTDAPVLFIYGTHDPNQPTSWPEDTAALLNEQGGGAFLQPIEGGHVPFTPDVRGTVIDQSTFFMYYKLDLAHAAR